MNTEITETVKGYVFYDGKCPLCRRWIGRMHGLLVRRGIHPVRMQADWAMRRLGLIDGMPLVEMKFLTATGEIYGGADAWTQIARMIWWAWPFFALAQIPGIKPVLRRIYRCVAVNRPCDDGHCPVPKAGAKEHRHIISAFLEFP